MPKKPSKKKILSELAEKLKQTAKVEIDEEKASKELDEDLRITNLEKQGSEFHSRVEIDSGAAPILERIVGSAVPRPIFVPRGGQAGPVEENRNAGEDGYLGKAGNTNEPTYVSGLESTEHPRIVDISEMGRKQTFVPETNPAIFSRFSDSRMAGSQDIEKYERPERFDVEKAGRRDLFEKADVKYERYKPKVPKG